MKEALFVKQNLQKWKAYEEAITGKKHITGEELTSLYIQLTDDLAYARTFYKGSQTEKYLNQLSAKTHQSIYKNKKERKDAIVPFFKRELPLLYRKNRNALLFSFVFFCICLAIGALSAHYEHEFTRQVMGDQYVNMTLENIEKGDPMAVYKDMAPFAMFVMIAVNNIWVSFTTFSFGLLFSAGSLYVLLKNGIMVGSFQYFFIQQELFVESALAIWMHGAMEISAIVLAGAAGLTMGNSFLFPGTYTRLESFTRGAIEGGKMILGLVPFFIVAAFIESFLTRHTEAHWVFRLMVIVLSFAFVIWYFVIYPYLIEKKENGKTRVI